MANQFVSRTGVYVISGQLIEGTLASGIVISGSIASGQVGHYHLSENIILSGNVASGQIGLYHLASGTVDGFIGSGSIKSGDLGLGVVNNENIASGTVANDKLENSSITLAGSLTALGGSWSPEGLTTASGLLGGTYYPSGSLTIGIASGGVVSAMLADASVISGKIASDSVNTLNITDAAVVSGKLATASVAASNIGDGEVVSGKLGFGSVTTSNLSSGVVSSGFIANESVLSGSIGSGQVGFYHLASGTVDELIGSGSIKSGDLGLGVVNNINIASGTISNDKLENNSLTIGGATAALGSGVEYSALTTSSGLLAATFYPSGAITIGIASGGVVSELIADTAIVSGKLAIDSVNSANITAEAVVSGKLATNSVNTGNIVDESVVSGKIASGQIGLYHLASGVMFQLSSGIVTSGHLGDYVVNSNNLNSGSVVTAALAASSVLSGQIGAAEVGFPHLASGVLFKVNNAADNRILTSLASGENGAYAETNLTYDGTTLELTSVSLNSTVFNVTGTNGAMLSVTDSNTDDILTVTNSSGNAAFVVYADSYVKILSGVHTGKSSNTVVFSVDDTAADGAVFDYTIVESGGARRTGTVLCSWNSSANTVAYNEASTFDLGGSTSAVSFSAAIANDKIELTANILSGTWDIKVSARLL